MSLALYGLESLRFYEEDEIELREMMVQRFASVARRTLQNMNAAWKFRRVEGPILTPKSFVSNSYDEDDIFVTQVTKAGQKLVLRPETTVSSYMFEKQKALNLKKLPLCVWQVGKSFRVEKSDGATAAKLRFNEFYQQEFQCIYSVGTQADYRAALIETLSEEISRFLKREVRVVDSDRIPEYSESTLDLEVMYRDEWKEVASCSIRKDFQDDVRVCEIALGLDRLVEIYGEKK